ncbi:MAG: ABC transporter substrate-binding protein [Pseudomonadota bacterium]
MTNQYPKKLGLLITLVAGLSATAFAQDRVVSVGGDVTEIIYALGEGNRIVASDSTSVYPPEAEETPKVGYVRNLSAEGVLSVEPDLILISGAAGPPPALQLLEASGVPIISMETAYTVEAIIEKTQRVAEALGATAAGEALVQQIEQDWAQAQSVLAEAEPMTILFFATPPDGSPLAAGTETAAQGIIDLLNGTNVFGSYSGYKPLSMEAAVAANPDIILVMHHHADRVGGMDSVKTHPALSLSPAAMADQIYPVDQVTVMQFGPRTPAAVGQLAEEIQQGQANVNER